MFKSCSKQIRAQVNLFSLQYANYFDGLIEGAQIMYIVRCDFNISLKYFSNTKKS